MGKKSRNEVGLRGDSLLMSVVMRGMKRNNVYHGDGCRCEMLLEMSRKRDAWAGGIGIDTDSWLIVMPSTA